MLPFSVAGVFGLAAAIVVVVSVVGLIRSHGSPALISYLLYVIFWHALILYMLVYLFSPQFLPDGAQQAYFLFNSIFIIPLHGLISFFFADFIWKWLGGRMPRALAFGLPVPFLAVLVVYARETLQRLSAGAQPGAFVLSAPLSGLLMFALLLASLGHAALTVRTSKDMAKRGDVFLFAGMTAGCLVMCILFVIGSVPPLGFHWQNAVTSMVLASVNIPGLLILRRSFGRQSHAAAAQLIGADLSGLEARYGISPREKEIISLVITGRSNREITEALFISTDTVKKHLYNIYRKMGVKNRVQLVNAVLGLTERPS